MAPSSIGILPIDQSEMCAISRKPERERAADTAPAPPLLGLAAADPLGGRRVRPITIVLCQGVIAQHARRRRPADWHTLSRPGTALWTLGEDQGLYRSEH